MELRKRITWSLVGLLAAVGIAAAMPTAPAMAEPDNGIRPYSSVDTSYYFEFHYFGEQCNTAPRDKDNDTAVYILVDNMTIYDVHLYADAVWGSGWENMTAGGYAYLVDPGPWRIRNWIYENGYRSARLRGMASESGVLGGLWSPDCDGQWPYLN